MTKKCFSLIHGQTIHLAPDQKVLSCESFSTLMSASDVKEKTLEDAIAYKKEVVKECEALKERAYQEGFEEGLKQFFERLADLEKLMQEEKEKIKQAVVPVAIKTVEKIFGRELSQSEDSILDIVKTSLKQVAQHKEVVIYIDKEHQETLEKNKENLKKLFEKIETLSVRVKDDIEPGGCEIVTDGGIINARIENRWTILKNAFEKLFNET